jgi:NAD(P)H-hydrate epimerase
MKVLSAEQMREVDRLTTERFGIPSIRLMENAAARTLEVAESQFGSARGRRALVICGKGNNGGDGAAIARLLVGAGATADLLLLGRLDETKGDARVNLERARSLAAAGSHLRLVEVIDEGQLKRESESRSYDLIFDAMLGTGLARPAAGLYENAIDLVNGQSESTPVIAVDIPSGIASDRPEVMGPVVRARLTVTFTAPKLGNVLPPASDFGGQLAVVSIGSPEELVTAAGSKVNLVDAPTVERWLAASRRPRHANKGDAGKVLIVAGSRGKTGAACLAGEAAMRAGAGLVTIASPASAQTVIASRAIPECMTELLAETESGSPAAEAAARVLELAADRDVIAIGPGLGSSEDEARRFVHDVVANRNCPIVLDADGLNLLAPWPRAFPGEGSSPLILTPHPGEMSRLTGKPILEILRERIAIAQQFAATYSVILVLKLSRTIIAAPDGEVYINPTGNEGIATGGSGDVLTGIVAGLIAQKVDDALGATVAAVYLHGLAGDIAASRTGIRAMVASDITSHLGEAFIEAGGPPERLDRIERRIRGDQQ